MVDIVIEKGLEIPIEGRASGPIKDLQTEEYKTATALQTLALDLSPFEGIRFRLKKKVGETVSRGEPLVEDKGCQGRVWTSPASGKIVELKRGLKRRLLAVVIEVSGSQDYIFEQLRVDLPKDKLIEGMLQTGLFTRIKTRPFDRLADPNSPPRSIFVKAIESAPFHVPPEMQIEGFEKEFQLGLDILSSLTDGKVHLVHHKESSFAAFKEAKNVDTHSFSGPHPCSHPSLHIQYIDPIQSYEDTVWVLDAYDVLCIGYTFSNKKVFTQKIVGVMGPGVIESKRGFYRVEQGYPIQKLIAGAVNGRVRVISGDVLTGETKHADDYLGFYDSIITLLPENTDRELLHFFRPGFGKFSATHAYISSWIKGLRKYYPFSTNQHGEKRAFIDANVYDKVMPLAVPVVPLVKAIQTGDFDLAEELGLLEVAAEDFALPTFICPSKIEMCDIVHKGLKQYADEVLA